jgi:hypothetical protein
MTIEDLEMAELFRNDPPQMAHESRLAGRAAGHRQERSSNEIRHGGFTITLRIKPDRRCLVTRVDPANERRRR